jgi:predicted nucleic acid-binding protein
LIAFDTSIVVAAFASWHEGHQAAGEALAREPRLPAHVAVESMSVLTRLPHPHRVAAPIVADFLASRFPEPLLTLSAEATRTLLRNVAAAGIAGGAIYDALVAATAQEAGAVLLSRDRRAATTYERLGAAYELLL